MDESSKIKELAGAWLTAKRLELEANQNRIEIEAQLLALTGSKQEGTTTIEIGAFEIKATGKLSYKVTDLAGLFNASHDWPEEIRPVSVEMNARESRLKKLRAEAPEYWKQVAKFIEVRPQKTAVTVTPIIDVGGEDGN
jgi:hypothetical protein